MSLTFLSSEKFFLKILQPQYANYKQTPTTLESVNSSQNSVQICIVSLVNSCIRDYFAIVFLLMFFAIVQVLPYPGTLKYVVEYNHTFLWPSHAHTNKRAFRKQFIKWLYQTANQSIHLDTLFTLYVHVHYNRTLLDHARLSYIVYMYIMMIMFINHIFISLFLLVFSYYALIYICLWCLLISCNSCVCILS